MKSADLVIGETYYTRGKPMKVVAILPKGRVRMSYEQEVHTFSEGLEILSSRKEQREEEFLTREITSTWATFKAQEAVRNGLFHREREYGRALQLALDRLGIKAAVRCVSLGRMEPAFSVTVEGVQEIDRLIQALEGLAIDGAR